MVREATRHLPNPPAIYGHNAGIGIKTRGIWREVIDFLARLDGIDFRQTAPVRPGSPYIRPYGAEWKASEEALTRPIAGINPTMITRAGALDQGNLILNLQDLESKGIAQNVLFLAGSAINTIKDKDGKPDPRIGLEAMLQAIEVHRSGELEGYADGRASGGPGGPGRAEEPGRASRGAAAALSGESRMIAKDERCLRIGVLGCGPIAQFAHLDACRKARNAELYAICDLADDLRERMAGDPPAQGRLSPTTTRCWPTPRSRRSSSPSPTSFTCRPRSKAIEAGKHVLVEKPLGTTVESCRELRDRAAAARLVVQVGNNRRFDPGIAFAREFIAEEMGQRIALKSWYYDSVYRYTMTDNLQPIPITSAKALRPEGDPKADRRRYYLLTHGSHLVDTARFLGGPIAGVRARLLERFGAYCWFIAVDFADGSLGHLDLQIPVRGDFQEGFQVYGEHGSVTGRVHLPWFHKSSDVECFSTRDRQFHRVLGEDAHTYKLQIEGFAATILDGVPQAGASLDDGLAAVQAMVAIARSVETGETSGSRM